jgi:hypothetical protein
MQSPGLPNPNTLPESIPPPTFDLAAMSPMQVDQLMATLDDESQSGTKGAQEPNSAGHKYFALRDDIYYFPLRDIDRAVPLYTTLTESQSVSSQMAAATGLDHLAIACRQRDGNIDAVLPIMVQLLVTGKPEGEAARLALTDLLEGGHLSQTDIVDLVREIVWNTQIIASRVEIDRGRLPWPRPLEYRRQRDELDGQQRHTESGGEPTAQAGDT